MMTSRLMTTINTEYYNFIEKESQNLSITKRTILEKALELYIKEKKRKDLASAYAVMESDTEYRREQQEMAEEGMDLYLDMLKQDEKI